MSAEENMALARRFLEARGEGDLDAIEQMMAPDFVDHTLARRRERDMGIMTLFGQSDEDGTGAGS